MTALVSERGRPLTKPRLEQIFRQCCEEGGVTGIRIHDLRRSFACDLNSVAGIQTVAANMGWDSLRTALHYLHERPRDRAEAAALLSLIRGERQVQPGPGGVQ